MFVFPIRDTVIFHSLKMQVRHKIALFSQRLALLITRLLTFVYGRGVKNLWLDKIKEP